MESLTDAYGRRMRKLRISLLDACNFRCLYCMPLNPKFMSNKEWLTSDEIISITEQLVSFGLKQVRVTGGEPTLRPEFQEIMARLSDLPLEKLALTTNGFSLASHLPFLKRTRCRHLNISIDSLKRENFEKITRAKHFESVIGAILQARQGGFEVKLNAVLMRGHNDHEVEDFLDFSAKHDVEVRFLELMQIGQARGLGQNVFISAAEILERIRATTRLIPQRVEHDSTSFNFTTEGGARVGFIASESQPFCGSCSRLRLSANGLLRACLMAESGISLKNLNRDEIAAALRLSMQRKPYQRAVETPIDMNQLGG